MVRMYVCLHTPLLERLDGGLIGDSVKIHINTVCVRMSEGQIEYESITPLSASNE